jgi:hypothetical protein
VTALASCIAAIGCISSSDDASAASSTTTGSGGAPSGTGGVAGSGAATTSTTGGAGVGADGGGGAGWAPDYCNLCVAGGSSPQESPLLDEVSGIVASAQHEGIFYVHNDSGDLARFFAIDSTGADQGEFVLQGGTHEDFEDIARGPCSAGSCIYVADIGDNDGVRTLYTLYRVAEPDAVGPGAYSTLPNQLKYQYPDGSHNAQALLIHPLTGEIAVVQSVTAGPSGIYGASAAWAPGELVTLSKLGELTPPSGSLTIGAADVHPLGHGILIRTFTHVYYYPAKGPREPLAATLSGPPCMLPAPNEIKGEAAAWNAAGDGYVTFGEGLASPIHHIQCPSE